MRLARNLTGWHVFSLALGTLLSSLFILPGLGFDKAGPGVILAYFLAGLLGLLGLLAQAELVSAMPKAGGTYYYVTRSLGLRLGGMFGLVSWVAMSLKMGYELLAVSRAAGAFLPVSPRPLAMIFCFGLVAMNIFGVKEAGRVQSVLVWVLILGVSLFCLFGIPQGSLERFKPFAANGFAAVLMTAGFVFASYGAHIKVASVAEEVKRPGIAVPAGMVVSFCVGIVIYCACSAVCVGVLEPGVLKSSVTPIASAAQAIFGQKGWVVFSGLGLLAILAATNVGLLAASRYPMAISRDGMLPEAFARLGETSRTPTFSILATGLLVAITLLFPLEALIKAASSVLILNFLFPCVSLIVLRESRVSGYRPVFRMPFYPFIPIMGALGYLILLASMGVSAILGTVGLLAGGYLLMALYGPKSNEENHAFFKVLARLLNKDFGAEGLERELRNVIFERETVDRDWLDHEIEKAEVIDLPGRIGFKELLSRASCVLSERTGLSKDILYRAILSREREGSTVLSPFLAIPHAIVEGKGVFAMALVRSGEGIFFDENDPDVHAAFVVIASLDRRHLYLKALAGLAQIVQDDHFERSWMSAESPEGIRNSLMLAKRKR